MGRAGLFAPFEPGTGALSTGLQVAPRSRPLPVALFIERMAPHSARLEQVRR